MLYSNKAILSVCDHRSSIFFLLKTSESKTIPSVSKPVFSQDSIKFAHRFQTFRSRTQRTTFVRSFAVCSKSFGRHESYVFGKPTNDCRQTFVTISSGWTPPCPLFGIYDFRNSRDCRICPRVLQDNNKIMHAKYVIRFYAANFSLSKECLIIQKYLKRNRCLITGNIIQICSSAVKFSTFKLYTDIYFNTNPFFSREYRIRPRDLRRRRIPRPYNIMLCCTHYSNWVGKREARLCLKRK